MITEILTSMEVFVWEEVGESDWLGALWGLEVLVVCVLLLLGVTVVDTTVPVTEVEDSVAIVELLAGGEIVVVVWEEPIVVIGFKGPRSKIFPEQHPLSAPQQKLPLSHIYSDWPLPEGSEMSPFSWLPRKRRGLDLPPGHTFKQLVEFHVWSVQAPIPYTPFAIFVAPPHMPFE